MEEDGDKRGAERGMWRWLGREQIIGTKMLMKKEHVKELSSGVMRERRGDW